MTGDSRGQTATIGIVLLFGVVAIGSMSILLVAGETVSDVEKNAATEHVTQGFVELSSELETVTYDTDTATSLDMAVGKRGAVRKENTGWIRINTSDFEENISLGAVIYESENADRIAYQAGGVWRGTGTETRMISAPPVHYEDSTLTLPVNNVTGDTEITSGNLQIDHDGTTTFDNTSVENEVVTLEIKSEYYVGWKEYFVSATNDAVVDDVDHDAKTVTIKLGNHELDETIDTGISVSGSVTNGGGQSYDEDEIEEGVTVTEFDPVIEQVMRDANTSENRVGTIDGTGGPYDEGTYFADEVDLTSELRFNLSEGNATLVVNGDISVEDADLIVDNWERVGATDRALKVYTTGDLDVNSQICVNPCDEDEVDSEQLQVYGSEETSVNLIQGGGGDTYFEGILYAPSDNPDEIHCSGENAQIWVHSNGQFDGAIVAGSAHFQSGSNSFNYDSSLEDITITGTPDGYIFPPDITYLNVVVHKVDITE